MPAPNRVWILTQTTDDGVDRVTTVLDVFISEEAVQGRILGWIKRGEMDKLHGLKYFARTVMTS